jgi:serine/threonine protein kinase
MQCPTCAAEIDGPGPEACPNCSAAVSSPTVSVDATVDTDAFSHRSQATPIPGALPSGTLVAGRYRVVRYLRSGGMGTIYQAEDLKLDVQVALKFLRAKHAHDPRVLELLLNEVRLAREIAHPNVCRLFDVGEIDGEHFLSMEYVEGEDLASLLRRIGRLPKDKAISIGLEICNGLEAAHQRGIVHRDLKPSNLMIDATGHAKIMDFGLAVLASRLEGQMLVAGTPDYMAPEQRRGESSVQTDVYAVGLVLYELFTGRKARVDLSGSGSSAATPLPAIVADDLDPTIERVIRHCLEPNPGMRPSSVNAIGAKLASLAAAPWRPSDGLIIPHRKHWVLERKLGRGGFGETWLAVHTKTRDRRVFKFCHDANKLKALQREITLFRFMRETLGGRDDIAALVDWQLEEPPYFIESEFAATGNLLDWFQAEGGPASIPLEERLDIIRRMAVALSAAHSVGVLHKDVKPANVLVHRRPDGSLNVRLCDFGVSMLTERARLQDAGVTAAGFTDTDDGSSSSDAGTRLYMAPEIIEGKPPTTGADVYALGVMLYQMGAGDLTKALASGWDRDIADDVLREDIAAAVEGAPERRVSAAQFAQRLLTSADRQTARKAEQEVQERTRQSEQAARRRRNWATAVLCALLVLGLGLGFAFKRAESSARQALLDSTLHSNEAMVRLAAAAVGDKLEAAIRRVKEEASDPVLRSLFAKIAEGAEDSARARDAVQRHLDQVLLRGKTDGFDSWAVADPQATVWARAPYDSVVVGGNYKYREWFNGRIELPRDAQVEAVPRTTTGFSLAFASTAINAPLLIGLASPITANTDAAQGAQQKVLGVLNAGIHLGTFNAWLGIAENRSPGNCPDRFVLLLHRGQLLRHPCPAPGAASLPVADYLSQAAVQALLHAPGGMSATFQDPMRAAAGSTAGPALAVAKSLESLPDWTLILQQDVDAALRPITALTDDFHKPAQFALTFGFGALILLVGLLWRGGFWRALLRSADGADMKRP